MPAGAKVPDSTAIVLYHFNDVWLLYYRSGSGGKLPGEQRKRVPEQLVPRIAATVPALFYTICYLWRCLG